ncbi:2-oxoacid:acceptor oxidoreductase subunit alpha [Candidatus Bathyarchaeota archaeon]|nr:2-oxoacid:acceptor oxidoreductase subunit alpha [Candidatus Bathyarchaeota archaeon]
MVGNHVKFATGNEAVALGALYANCRFFAGYPITPATEILEIMAEYMPLLDGYFIQMEDEISAMSAIIGASWNGIRTMTATSGPGFSLMQENIGYAIMTETPCVIVNVMRSGPSTGQPTLPSQGDYYQARWGTHGDHIMLVLAPSSVQESFDLTIKAFNLADKYRIPVVLLSDATIAHMRERLIIPRKEQVEIIERTKVTIDPDKYQPFRTGLKRASKVPEMDRLGDHYHTHLTGLTHDNLAFPNTNSASIHEKLVKRLYAKVLDDRHVLAFHETYRVKDCDTLLVAFGIAARPCYDAVDMARKQGKKWGFLKLQAVWPFPRHLIYEYAKQVRKMIVVELNMGQMVHKVLEYSRGACDVKLVGKIGGELISPDDILYESLPSLDLP